MKKTTNRIAAISIIAPKKIPIGAKIIMSNVFFSLGTSISYDIY